MTEIKTENKIVTTENKENMTDITQELTTWANKKKMKINDHEMEK